MDSLEYKKSKSHNLLNRFSQRWHCRAGIRKDAYYDQNLYHYDLEKPDYPLEIIPFSEHPLFIKINEQQKQQILTWAWLTYNERVLEIEDLVTAPAINNLLHHQTPGAEDLCSRRVLQQTLIDEQFHLMMHEVAILETKKAREITLGIDFPHSIIYTSLRQLQDQHSQQWEKNLLQFIWAVVSEMTINAYLDLLAKSDEIQTSHQKLNELHNKDELAHNKIFIELTKLAFWEFNKTQKNFFISNLSKALLAFTQHDFSTWSAILSSLKVPNWRNIIEDSMRNTKKTHSKLISKISGIKTLAEEIEIHDELHYEFT